MNLLKKIYPPRDVYLYLIIAGFSLLLWIAPIMFMGLNYWLQPSTDKSITSSKEIKVINLYPIYPVEGDEIGSLNIPSLNRLLPIFQGTSTNELDRGVGHFIKSALPGENNNSVISGHRDTAFRQLDNLKLGDLLIITTNAGVFTYKISATKIVSKDDRSIISYTDHPVLTLTTCYPFNYIGNAPKRYIVIADLIKN